MLRSQGNREVTRASDAEPQQKNAPKLTLLPWPAKQGVTREEDTVSGLMFADYFVGISETPEGSQKQIEKARVHWEMGSDS